MKRPAKQPTRARNRLPSDLAGLLRKAFPDGVVELPPDGDEIDLDAVYRGLKQELAAIDGAALLYERGPDGGPVWDDEADPSDDPPSDIEHDRSYLLMFLALKDERFRYEAEDLIEDEQCTTRVQGTGRIGCTLAVSVLAPVALVKFDDMEQLEDGSEILPQVEDRIFDLDVNPVDLEETTRAHRSLRRHLHHHPRDVHGWELLAIFEPVRAAARCGFHGGPLLDTAGELIDLVCEDGLQPIEHWLLNYAWFTRQAQLDEIRDTLDAEHMLASAPLAVPLDARAFAWYLLDAGGQRYVGRSVGVIEARQRLKRISQVAFRRYLARV